MNFFVAVCPATHVLTASGACVNIMNDFNNCGTIGYVCSSNYTRCVGARCKAVPIVQLVNPTAIVSGTVQGNIDDAQYGFNLPFNITLYNATRNRVTVTTNGVSFL